MNGDPIWSGDTMKRGWSGEAGGISYKPKNKKQNKFITPEFRSNSSFIDRSV